MTSATKNPYAANLTVPPKVIPGTEMGEYPNPSLALLQSLPPPSPALEMGTKTLPILFGTSEQDAVRNTEPKPGEMS